MPATPPADERPAFRTCTRPIRPQCGGNQHASLAERLSAGFDGRPLLFPRQHTAITVDEAGVYGPGGMGMGTPAWEPSSYEVNLVAKIEMDSGPSKRFILARLQRYDTKRLEDCLRARGWIPEWAKLYGGSTGGGADGAAEGGAVIQRGGPMQKSPLSIVMSPSERTELSVLACSCTRGFALVQRARIILLLAEQVPLRQISLQLGIQRRIVRKWGRRFANGRIQGLQDAPRPGRPARFSPGGHHASGQAGL